MVQDVVKEIIDSYNFAKEKGFDSIVIAIDAECGSYTISEYEGGFISDPFDCTYKDIEDIAEDLVGIIKGGVYEIRIE